jgi:hypothetical protein
MPTSTAGCPDADDVRSAANCVPTWPPRRTTTACRVPSSVGHPTTLAQGYMEGTGYSVRWRTGAIAALATFTLLYTLTLSFFIAFSFGATEIGGAGVSLSYAYEIAPGWGPLVASGDATSAEVLLMSPFHLILIAVA